LIKDDKKFWTWFRSGLRRLSQRYPTLYSVLHEAKRPYNGPNKRQKVCYECADCKGLFSGKDVAVDHIIACGSLTCKEDVADFIDRLFCDKEGLQVLCKTCHDLKTVMDKNGVTKEEALIMQKVTQFSKLKAAQQIKVLQEYDSCGKMAATNSKERIALYRRIIEEGK